MKTSKVVLDILKREYWNILICFFVFLLEYSSHSAMSDIKSFHLATIETTDPSILINMSLEVTLGKYGT